MTGSAPPLVALSIAGSDPSGGAGIQADLKTFSAFGVYGAAAITALTVQNTQGVSGVSVIDPDFVRAQIAAVLEDLKVTAVKVGMLGTRAVATAVADVLTSYRPNLGLIVVDPVSVSTSGHQLLDDDAVEVIRRQLLSVADIVTPNLAEAALLLNEPVAGDVDALIRQATALQSFGGRAVLVKGGHLDHDRIADVFAAEGLVRTLPHPRIATRNTHGTGCTLSSAIAAAGTRTGVQPFADPAALFGFVQAGEDFLLRSLRSSADWQLSRSPDTGHGPVDHLVDFDPGAVRPVDAWSGGS